MLTVLQALVNKKSQQQEAFNDLIGLLNSCKWSYDSWGKGALGQAHWCSKVYDACGIDGYGMTIEIHNARGVLMKGDDINNIFLKVSFYDLSERGGHVSLQVKRFYQHFRGKLTVYLKEVEDYQTAINLLKEIQQYN